MGSEEEEAREGTDALTDRADLEAGESPGDVAGCDHGDPDCERHDGCCGGEHTCHDQHRKESEEEVEDDPAARDRFRLDLNPNCHRIAPRARK